MTEPIWQRYRIVVDVDVQSVDSNGFSFVFGAREAARKAIQDAVGFRDDLPARDCHFDKNGQYAKAWSGQVKIRRPEHLEEA